MIHYSDDVREKRVLIVFDDMIADMESNKKFSPFVTELFLREITILFQSA